MYLLTAIITSLLLIPMASCVRKDSSEVMGLKEEVAKLKQTVEGIKPGLGEIMGVIQQHHEKLYFSGLNENWPLAQYEFDEIKENLDRVTDLYEHFEDLKVSLIELRHLTDTPMQEIKKAMEEKNKAKFMAEFNALTQSCNQCHQAAEHAFIRIQIPHTSSFSNQKFSIN